MVPHYDEVIHEAEVRRAEKLAEHDGYIVNALVKCSTFKNSSNEAVVPDWPTIFSLTWGSNMASHAGFPTSLQLIVADILAEERKCEESYDSQEKQVHIIAIDLLQFMYEMQVNAMVKRMKEEAGIK